MAIEKLTDIIGEENVAAVRSELDNPLGAITDVEVAVGGGLVHHVLQTKGDSVGAYLKIRGNFYAGLPQIPNQPELIDNEKKAYRATICQSRY